MLNHIGVSVADFERSKAFYQAALKPLGLSLVWEITAAETGADAHAGFGTPDKAFFWLGTGAKPKGGTHVAFTAGTRTEVELLLSGRDRRRRQGQRPSGPEATLPRELLRRFRAQP